MKKVISLAHGNGGLENQTLIEELFWRHLGNDILKRGEDSAKLPTIDKMAFTTDSFTVSPIFFNGGDIGKLSICGTCNDLAMVGAKPEFITLSVVIEEGFSQRDLEKIIRSIKRELAVNGAIVVGGDTKVVPKGAVDKIFITTSGIGKLLIDSISISNIEVGDTIIVSQDIGRHGATIFIEREGIEFQSELKSDCASLFPQVKALLDAKLYPKALRDATRGGVASALNEWARANSLTIELDEESIPISDEVKGVCELLGFEALALANEGTFIMAIDSQRADLALEILKSFNQNASIIGRVTDTYPKRVILNTPWGTKRFLDMPTGELLPRIC